MFWSPSCCFELKNYSLPLGCWAWSGTLSSCDFRVWAVSCPLCRWRSFPDHHKCVLFESEASQKRHVFDWPRSCDMSMFDVFMPSNQKENQCSHCKTAEMGARTLPQEVVNQKISVPTFFHPPPTSPSAFPTPRPSQFLQISEGRVWLDDGTKSVVLAS